MRLIAPGRLHTMRSNVRPSSMIKVKDGVVVKGTYTPGFHFVPGDPVILISVSKIKTMEENDTYVYVLGHKNMGWVETEDVRVENPLEVAKKTARAW